MTAIRTGTRWRWRVEGAWPLRAVLERRRDRLDGNVGDELVDGVADEEAVRGGRGNDRLFGDPGDGVPSGDHADYDLMGDDVLRLNVGPDGLLNGVAIGGFADIQALLIDGPEGTFLPLGTDPLQGIILLGIFRNQLSADDFVIV